MGKSTISMVIFNSYVSHYQRVDPFTWNLNHQKASAEIVSLEPSLKWSPAMRSFISSISPAMHWFCWENLHWVYHVWLVMLLVRFNHLEKIYEFVNGKDEMENKHCLKPPTRCFFSHDIWGCSGFNMSFNQSIEANWSTPKIGGRIGASILTHTPTPQPSNQVSLNDGQSCKEIG